MEYQPTWATRGTFDLVDEATNTVIQTFDKLDEANAVGNARNAAIAANSRSPLQAAIDRGMQILRGPEAPDEMIEILERLGRPMSREKIREVIHAARRRMNIGPAEDLILDRSGGMWDSRTGEYIGKMWEII